MRKERYINSKGRVRYLSKKVINLYKANKKTFLKAHAKFQGLKLPEKITIRQLQRKLAINKFYKLRKKYGKYNPAEANLYKLPHYNTTQRIRNVNETLQKKIIKAENYFKRAPTKFARDYNESIKEIVGNSPKLKEYIDRLVIEGKNPYKYLKGNINVGVLDEKLNKLIGKVRYLHGKGKFKNQKEIEDYVKHHLKGVDLLTARGEGLVIEVLEILRF